MRTYTLFKLYAPFLLTLYALGPFALANTWAADFEELCAKSITMKRSMDRYHSTRDAALAGYLNFNQTDFEIAGDAEATVSLYTSKAYDIFEPLQEGLADVVNDASGHPVGNEDTWYAAMEKWRFRTSADVEKMQEIATRITYSLAELRWDMILWENNILPKLESKSNTALEWAKSMSKAYLHAQKALNSSAAPKDLKMEAAAFIPIAAQSKSLRDVLLYMKESLQDEVENKQPADGYMDALNRGIASVEAAEFNDPAMRETLLATLNILGEDIETAEDVHSKVVEKSGPLLEETLLVGAGAPFDRVRKYSEIPAPFSTTLKRLMEKSQ